MKHSQTVMILIALVFLPMLLISPVNARYDCEPDVLEVLFQPEHQVRLRAEVLKAQAMPISASSTQQISELGDVRWERLTGELQEETLDEYQLKAEQSLEKPVYNMNNIFYLHLLEGQDVWDVAEQLKTLPEVLNAYPVPKPMPLPTPNWEGDQDYLKNKPDWPPTGLNAYAAWAFNGGDGTGVTICDLEYSWNLNHVDLTKAANGQKNPNGQDPFNDPEHGTAVLGEMIADNNGWGVTGISHGANAIVYGTYYDPNPPHSNPFWRMGEAMTNSLSYLQAGDVMLLEHQWEYNLGQANYIPVEWFGSYSPQGQSMNSVYAAIVTAVGNGVHVVEAAGNGGVDLDTLSWYGDSGAIVVGAGGAYSGGFYPGGDLEPLQFSCYGSRVDVHAWGEDVTTTGYGYYTGATGPNDYFTYSFAGTSSASPMVASAVACCVGYWKGTHFQPASSLTPINLRTILISTGTPQDTTWTTDHIGPRPDIVEAFKIIDTRAPATFVSVDLQMPKNFYNAGDVFFLDVLINNPGPPGGIVPLAILLEIQGSFWFYPSWSTSFDYDNYQLFQGASVNQIIPLFTWPTGTGTLNGINFYGALLTTDFSGILGLYDVETFGFSS